MATKGKAHILRLGGGDCGGLNRTTSSRWVLAEAAGAMEEVENGPTKTLSSFYRRYPSNHPTRHNLGFRRNICCCENAASAAFGGFSLRYSSRKRVRSRAAAAAAAVAPKGYFQGPRLQWGGIDSLPNCLSGLCSSGVLSKSFTKAFTTAAAPGVMEQLVGCQIVNRCRQKKVQQQLDCRP